MHSPLVVRMAQQRNVVLQLATQLDQAATSEDKLRLQDQLRTESNKLARMVAGARRKIARRGHSLPVEAVTPEQAAARKSNVVQRLHDVNVEIAQISILWEKNKGNHAVRQSLRLKYQLLLTERVHLHRRLVLLRHGKDYVQPRWLSPMHVRVWRKKLGLPVSYPTPSVTETDSLIRLLATRIERRKEDTDQTFRERLLSYVRRALVRWAHYRSRGAPPDASVAQAAMETIQEDSPAIEAEADAGGTIQDPAADVFIPMVESEPVQEQVDTVVEDIQPTIIQNSDPAEVVIEAEALAYELEGQSGPPLGQLDSTMTSSALIKLPAPTIVATTATPTTSADFISTPVPMSTVSTSSPAPVTKPVKVKVPKPKKKKPLDPFVPVVPTFSKAGSKKTTVTSSSTVPVVVTDPTTGEQVVVATPVEMPAEVETELDSSTPALAPSSDSSKMMWVGLGLAVLVGGYLILRKN